MEDKSLIEKLACLCSKMSGRGVIYRERERDLQAQMVVGTLGPALCRTVAAIFVMNFERFCRGFS